MSTCPNGAEKIKWGFRYCNTSSTTFVSKKIFNDISPRCGRDRTAYRHLPGLISTSRAGSALWVKVRPHPFPAFFSKPSSAITKFANIWETDFPALSACCLACSINTSFSLSVNFFSISISQAGVTYKCGKAIRHSIDAGNRGLETLALALDMNAKKMRRARSPGQGRRKGPMFASIAASIVGLPSSAPSCKINFQGLIPDFQRPVQTQRRQRAGRSRQQVKAHIGQPEVRG